MKVVEVKWADAWIDTSDVSLKKAKKLKPVVRTTIGFFVGQNDEGIILCTDFYEKEKETINAPMCIPNGMVLDWWIYETCDHHDSHS